MEGSISIVIPARDEEAIIGRAVERVVGQVHEVIVVDGGSSDATAARAQSAGARVLPSPAGRGAQQNAGAEASTGDIILFLHADTVLPAGFADEVFEVLGRPRVVAGAFPLAFEASDERVVRQVRFNRAVANWRARHLQLPYGDQALFMHRTTFFGAGGFPDWLLMEDVELVRRVKRLGRLALARSPVLTSARRWEEHGRWRTTIINQLAITAFFLGISPSRIHRWREGRLSAEFADKSSAATDRPSLAEE